MTWMGVVTPLPRRLRKVSCSKGQKAEDCSILLIRGIRTEEINIIIKDHILFSSEKGHSINGKAKEKNIRENL